MPRETLEGPAAALSPVDVPRQAGAGLAQASRHGPGFWLAAAAFAVITIALASRGPRRAPAGGGTGGREQ